MKSIIDELFTTPAETAMQTEELSETSIKFFTLMRKSLIDDKLFHEIIDKLALPLMATVGSTCHMSDTNRVISMGKQAEHQSTIAIIVSVDSKVLPPDKLDAIRTRIVSQLHAVIQSHVDSQEESG